MGRYITCPCGQRNDIEAFQFGEARQCLACGTMLPREADYYKAEEFAPLATDFARAPGGDFSTANEFESPSSLAEEQAAPPPVERAWEGRVREAVPAAVEGVRCVRCNRAFRGAWDQHASPDGLVCHICATQAEKDYEVPADWLRRELYRPSPPRKLQQAPDPNADEAKRKKRKEIIMLSAAAVVTLIAINILPVEAWVARIFAADLERAADLPSAWYWVSRGVHIVVSIFGQGLTLYAALAWTKLLYEGGLEENWRTLTGLAIVFTVLNELTVLAAKYFIVFGPAAGILIGMAAVVGFMTKMLLISDRYPLRVESGFSFLLSWIACGLLLWPCTFAVHQVLQGIVSAIAL